MQNKDIELLVFSAPWCHGCKVLKKNLEENNIPFKEVNVDEDKNSELVTKWSIRGLPTILVVRNGEAETILLGAGSIKDILELMN